MTLPFSLCAFLIDFSTFFFCALEFLKRITTKTREKKTRKNTQSTIMLSGEGVVTRARKRKVGERDSLWDLVVKNDDISLTHIIPTLNATDVKFLYGVNSETRKLIKRSSRAGDLKKAFKIEEMSSISTLEFAWENKSLWSGLYLYDETYFCEEVARTNKLELLKWTREKKKCEWDSRTITAAALRGNLEMVKYCVANECPIDWNACAYAARNGHLECLKCLREEAKAPWDSSVLYRAHAKKHLECLRYAVKKKCPGWSGYTERLKELEQAAGVGDVDRGVSFSSRLYHLYVVFFVVFFIFVLLFFIFVFLDEDVWAHRDGEQSQ